MAGSIDESEYETSSIGVTESETSLIGATESGTVSTYVTEEEPAAIPPILLLDLPNEVLLTICKNLSDVGLANVSHTCHKLFNLAHAFVGTDSTEVLPTGSKPLLGRNPAVYISKACQRFSNYYKKFALRNYKTLFVTDRLDFEGIKNNFASYYALFKDVVEDLQVYDVLLDASEDHLLRQNVVKNILSKFTHLKTIRIFAGWRRHATRFTNITVTSTVSTVSFVISGFIDVYESIKIFGRLSNLNCVSCKYKLDTDDEHDWHDEQWHSGTMLTWLRSHNVRDSIWLPNFISDLSQIGNSVKTIHTIRIYFGIRYYIPPDLTLLKNLKSLRIECYTGNNLTTTHQAVTILNEYPNASNLKELHLCCDFQVFSLEEILYKYDNLEKLIIEHYERESLYVNLEENLSWPRNLRELKCIRFIIANSVVFDTLFQRKSFQKLDIYFCDLKKLSRINREVDETEPTMKILLTERRAKLFGADQVDQEYLRMNTYLSKNYHHKKFDVLEGLGIYIQFVGIEETEFWHCMDQFYIPHDRVIH